MIQGGPKVTSCKWGEITNLYKGPYKWVTGGEMTLTDSLPETNRKFAPKNGCLEDYRVSFWGV